MSVGTSERASATEFANIASSAEQANEWAVDGPVLNVLISYPFYLLDGRLLCLEV